MKRLSIVSICLLLSFVSVSARDKLSEDESVALHDQAMDIIGSTDCRNRFRQYIDKKNPKAFAYTVDPRGYYSQCNAVFDSDDATQIALSDCNKARDKSKYITKFSPECKLLAQDNTLLLTMADFALKPHELNLSFAAQRKSLTFIKKLVKEGANIQQKNSFGSTPLLKAAQEGRLDVVEYFLEQGADINHKQERGFAPLSIAALRSNTSLVSFLLSKGADINTTAEAAEKNPIHYAAERGNKAIVEQLISKGADINEPDKNGVTPLHYAVDRTNLDAVKMLVEMGANVHAKSDSGKTPLDYTKRKKKLKIKDYLLKHGAGKKPIKLKLN